LNNLFLSTKYKKGAFSSKERKMIALQHHHNNCTTFPHMGWGPVCGTHPM
jgi:hypothetical protein